VNVWKWHAQPRSGHQEHSKYIRDEREGGAGRQRKRERGGEREGRGRNQRQRENTERM